MQYAYFNLREFYGLETSNLHLKVGQLSLSNGQQQDEQDKLDEKRSEVSVTVACFCSSWCNLDIGCRLDSNHRRRGWGLGGCNLPTCPIIFQRVIFGQKSSNIRAKPPDFRTTVEKIFGPPWTKTGPVRLWFKFVWYAALATFYLFIHFFKRGSGVLKINARPPIDMRKYTTLCALNSS